MDETKLLDLVDLASSIDRIVEQRNEVEACTGCELLSCAGWAIHELVKGFSSMATVVETLKRELADLREQGRLGGGD